MREFQATEAKTRLAELLRVVEHGEAIAITRHGKTIAHLVPAATQDRLHREKAVEQFRQRRAGGSVLPSPRTRYLPCAMRVTASERIGCRRFGCLGVALRRRRPTGS